MEGKEALGNASKAGESSMAGRKVRTVPPSARFEPPSPSVSSHPPPLVPPSSAAGPSIDPEVKRSRIIRRRYSTSEGTSDGTSDYDTTEDENPWWTFTSRGMAKMKARANRMYHPHDARESGIEELSTVEDTRPEREKKHRRPDVLHRKKRKSTESSSRRSFRIPIRRQSGVESDGPPLPSPGSLLAPAIISPSAPTTPREAHPHTYFLRRSHWRDSPQPTTPDHEPSAPGLNRSNSAPSSPTHAQTHFFQNNLARSPEVVLSRAMDSDDPRSSLDPILSGRRKTSSSRPIPPVRRQSTTPYLPKFRKRRERGDVPSDTESPSELEARPKPLRLSSHRSIDRPGKLGHDTRSSSRRKIHLTASKSRLKHQHEDDDRGVQTDTPTRPRNFRKSTHKLKLQLPEPLTDHFRNGWPQAGSWQDAYYGLNSEAKVHESPKAGSHTSSRHSPVGGSTSAHRKRSKSLLHPLRGKLASASNTPGTEYPASSPAEPHTPVIPPPMGRNKSQRKSKRKRHRIAQMPPTPSGLGFTPSGAGEEENGAAWKEGRISAGEFNWSNGNAHHDASRAENGNAGPNLRNKEAGTSDDTSRQATSPTGKSEVSSRHWGFFASRLRARKERRSMRVVEEDWRKRWRRMLFLDARVTIYIRLLNLAGVVASLALAVTIRIRLSGLGVPGIMGSSTTLIMAYSSLTIIHVLTAIYREYFGRPIGLWGLRSKMLWVCLDLLFIALWSSAVSDSTNDYIATPLMCTSGSAWWSYEIDSSIPIQAANAPDTLFTGTVANLHSVLGSGTTYKMLDIVLPDEFTESGPVKEVCRRQVGCIALCMFALLLYVGNMVLSLFRIFETVRRTSSPNKALSL